MHFTNTAALALAFLSTSVFAAPTPTPQAGREITATIQLANEESGAYADVTLPVDGVKRPVQELWGHTAVAQHGLVFASSAQLTAFEQTTVCTFTEEPRLSATVDADKTWTSLGGSVVELCDAFVTCVCEGM
ncbi:uncharacterized protein N7459_003753 [Penicillium hispanicum]|uniref:uncharacterized protein n=1 Tax=Penicillium hispanicum TaxID=1080232 RepID=UPI002540E2DF|nr:uncharacterized protein N7459_003753 [Penicillium hispanicum]KAJ5587988.1 hypothetical protein N7459_003753 [Penicillium hispanicum]